MTRMSKMFLVYFFFDIQVIHPIKGFRIVYIYIIFKVYYGLDHEAQWKFLVDIIA